MSELFEVVFEGVPQSFVCEMYLAILKKSIGINELQCREDWGSKHKGAISEKQLNFFIELPSDATLTVKVSHLIINKHDIPNVHLNLVKYGGNFDIDFNFDELDLTTNVTEVMKEIHHEISEIAMKYNVENWFAGMEPANDIETRYFTKNNFH